MNIISSSLPKENPIYLTEEEYLEIRPQLIANAVTQFADEIKKLEETREKRLLKIKEAKEKQNKLTLMFYRIFEPKKGLSSQEMENLFNKYIADGSLSIEEIANDNNKPYKINSMDSIISYLKEHPAVIACDFRGFNSNNISDVTTLVNYLKGSTIKAIALDNKAPQELKSQLQDLKIHKAASKLPFTIAYLAS